MCVCKFVASARRRVKREPHKRWLWSKSKSAWEKRGKSGERKRKKSRPQSKATYFLALERFSPS